ncbi:hypothetical protein [Protaetiibacter larvae]|uniref:Uncharacterized protein n=1 Tax=Protaetiibacter larvae TaxID=2592654 RepID=A0A5C1Y5G9_9MICO|nr:hypothetical protein [Protaetiibacter larvae]QEO08569.1 hypothetical protein FLP23_00105 [Protaetiibacter larvae]
MDDRTAFTSATWERSGRGREVLGTPTGTIATLERHRASASIHADGVVLGGAGARGGWTLSDHATGEQLAVADRSRWSGARRVNLAGRELVWTPNWARSSAVLAADDGEIVLVARRRGFWVTALEVEVPAALPFRLALAAAAIARLVWRDDEDASAAVMASTMAGSGA